jgi:hypothetical protein
MPATLVKTILSANSGERLHIFRSTSGAFYFEEEWFRDYSLDEAFREYNLTPGTGDWVGTERSGYYASVEEAERAARQTYKWMS